MVTIFNISSAGFTATKWMTFVLNHHPKVSCFQAIRADPFMHFDDMENPENKMPIHNVVGGLKQLHKRSINTKAIGVCHLFYNSTDVRQSFIQAGGRHAVVFRNIIQRIHSGICRKIFIQYDQKITGKELYVFLSRKFDKTYSIEDLGSGKEQPIELTLFHNLLSELILSDWDNFMHAQPEERILFEKAVTEPEYLVNSFAHLLDMDMECIKPVILENFSQPHHQHSGGKRATDMEWFQAWPELYRMFFGIFICQFGIDKFTHMYSSLGYPIDKRIVKYLQLLQKNLF